MRDWLRSYPETLFQSKNDLEDPRLVDFLTREAPEAQFVLWGYPDDEGIRLSGGRLGAKQAPLQIREIFFKLTPPRKGWLEHPPKIYDAGFLLAEEDLASRHEKARKLSAAWSRQGKYLCTLGGGHDYAYGDASGFIDTQLELGLKPLVINIDAHLDVRPTDRGLSSGTPFRRVLEEFGRKIDFIEIGIQKHCSSQVHHDYVKSFGFKIYDMDEISSRGFSEVISEVLKAHSHQPSFLSIDIDAFNSMEAPGCSQSWPTGIKSEDFFCTLPQMIAELDIRSMGVYEVSPPLDPSLGTQRLAALILYDFISETHQKFGARS